MQFYSGNFFDGTTTSKYGRALRFRELLAFETQCSPNGPNCPELLAMTLRFGETYKHTCVRSEEHTSELQSQ